MIELDDIAYAYDGRALFSGVSLALTPGSFHFLTGPSGSGKTTLIRLCYGALAANTGSVRLFGKNVAEMNRDQVALARRRIGIVHQDGQFLDHLSVRENVALPLTVSNRMDDEAAAQIDDLLAWTGLSTSADRSPPELSGGERQRAALARAVIMSPEVVLADEPTGNIDAEMSDRLIALLVELNRMGRAVLIATHDMSLIRRTKAQVAARVVRLTKGRLEMAGADL
ncbi:cell division ATP-binding protein FtsE [Aestuariibius sp. 2305UL40-4]|uniref:cell division ATP-binding protein FtsE n=1 Tax=Aestuariibius violaceus TaxID=3234132 RepID=UPI00345EF559